MATVRNSNKPAGKGKQKVFVGLSGGVDSAVSAALLQAQGYDVTGVFIRIALLGYPCSAGVDKLEAMRVAAHLRIPFMEIDMSKNYQKTVFQSTLAEYKQGRTPNPDTLCNKNIKFGAFYEFARAQGADYIATGHYARTSKKPAKLYVSSDAQKDQSYFLWTVPEEVLEQTLFPVGELQKSEVRMRAKKFGLPNSERKDSQGLCFLGDIAIADMLEQELHPSPGAVLDEHGAVVGTHNGAALYTLGQRHGFILHAQTNKTLPHFVVAKNMELNEIVVATSPYPVGASKTVIHLAETNWIGAVAPGNFEARYRYRQPVVPATLVSMAASTAQVELALPRYVPLGQSLVIYSGDRCVGGGVVDCTELL